MMKIIALAILTLLSFCVSGQDTVSTSKIKEYYFTLDHILPLNVSFKYKKQLKNHTFWKLGLVNLSVINQKTDPNSLTMFSTSRNAFSSGLEFGLEFRKMISDKFMFIHGPNLSATINRDVRVVHDPSLPERQRRIINQTYTGGIPYTFGFLYHLSNNFLLTAEFNPGIFFSHITSDNRMNPEANYNINFLDLKFTNGGGVLSIAYRP